jgi:Fe-S-cluster containining protein
MKSTGVDNKTINESLRQEYIGITCMFLSKAGYCVVYPVRPMICRTWKATRPCGITRSEERDTGLLIKLVLDRAAMVIVNENDILMNSKSLPMPLVAWPTTKQFYKEFF